MADAKTLLLVHNQKAKVLELDVLLKQLVGADDQVDATRGQILKRLFLLRGCAEA